MLFRSQYVREMQDMIRRLQEKKLAYQSASGDVNYAVRRFPGYGNLSGKSIDELRAGERVDVDASKEDPLDFVLWKRAKPGEPKWPSQWGDGRPGWHIECSAMSCTLLGEQFDIHGGGMDLQFPHHENEIAQSEGATGKPFVKYWMHNGFLNIDNEKMSKSLGNFFVVRDVLKHYDPEVIRFFLLRSHYRSELNYTEANLEDAKNSLRRLYTALMASSRVEVSGVLDSQAGQRFKKAMDDDFATPEAIALLHELANQVFHSRRPEAAIELRELGKFLGILQRDPTAFLQGRELAADLKSASSMQAGLTTGEFFLKGFDKSVGQLVRERNDARRRKDFKEADRIRQVLLDAGIVLEDRGPETTWRRV